MHWDDCGVSWKSRIKSKSLNSNAFNRVCKPCPFQVIKGFPSHPNQSLGSLNSRLQVVEVTQWFPSYNFIFTHFDVSSPKQNTNSWSLRCFLAKNPFVWSQLSWILAPEWNQSCKNLHTFSSKPRLSASLSGLSIWSWDFSMFYRSPVHKQFEQLLKLTTWITELSETEYHPTHLTRHNSFVHNHM